MSGFREKTTWVIMTEQVLSKKDCPPRRRQSLPADSETEFVLVRSPNSLIPDLVGSMAFGTALLDRMRVVANAAVHLATRELPKFIVLSLRMAASTVLRFRGDFKDGLERALGMLVEQFRRFGSDIASESSATFTSL